MTSTDRDAIEGDRPNEVINQTRGLDEVYKLVDILLCVESGVQKAAEAWKVGTSHFVSSYKILDNQISNINNLLQLQRKSIAAIYEDNKNSIHE